MSEFNWWSIYVVTMGENPWFFDEVKGWHYDDWQVFNDGAPLLAKKVIDVQTSDGGINYTTSTTFLLTHKPGS